MAGKGLLVWILDVCLDSAACSSYRATPVRADHLLVSAHSDVYEDYVLCMIGLFINSMPFAGDMGEACKCAGTFRSHRHYIAEVIFPTINYMYSVPNCDFGGGCHLWYSTRMT